MKKDTEIRIPATSVLLVCVLRRIIREELGFAPDDPYEGWMFEHNAEYRIPSDEAYSYNCSSYTGSTKIVLKDMGAVEVRMHADRTDWDALPSSGSVLWRFDVWLKPAQGERLVKSFSYGEGDDKICQIDTLPEHTPRKIDLWFRQ